jgi:hypothetical protein
MQMTAAAPPDTCATCYGQGEVVTDTGPLLCRDCMGQGRVGGRLELHEWRLRDIERAHPTDEDVRWLAMELRRSRDALLQILARCQDAPESDAMAAEIRYLANGCLTLYATKLGAK